MSHSEIEPSKSDGDIKKVNLTVRVTRRVRDEFHRNADKKGFRASALIRSFIDGFNLQCSKDTSGLTILNDISEISNENEEGFSENVSRPPRTALTNSKLDAYDAAKDKEDGKERNSTRSDRSYQQACGCEQSAIAAGRTGRKSEKNGGGNQSENRGCSDQENETNSRDDGKEQPSDFEWG